MSRILIQNATLVNEGCIQSADVLIEGDFISAIASAHSIQPAEGTQVIDATGLHLLPGLIDDQVHFREPGLTHKVLVDMQAPYVVQKEDLLYKCGWSPFEGATFHSRVV
ncbi:MAG: hypothetical protein ACKO6L_08730, partial [Flavobacteriales bacterium]